MTLGPRLEIRADRNRLASARTVRTCVDSPFSQLQEIGVFGRLGLKQFPHEGATKPGGIIPDWPT